MISLITQRKNDEKLALAVERNFKDFDSRLISSIQFTEGKATIPENAPIEMIHSMIREAETESRRFNFNKIVNFKKNGPGNPALTNRFDCIRWLDIS